MSGKRRCGVGVWASMGLNVSSALPRRWLRVKQVAWRRDGGLLVRFLAVGCGLNSRLAAGWGFTGALPRRWLRVKQVAWWRVVQKQNIALVVRGPTRSWQAIKGCYENPILEGPPFSGGVLVDVMNRIDNRLFRV